MTSNGWLQIALFGVIVIAITRPFGGYMTRVFAGERTFLSPVLRPLERLVYWCCGVDETQEQSWRTYAVSMVFFGVAGFVTLYVLQRLQWYLPFNPQGQAGVDQVLAFNTSVSFVTNTNWQSYVPETTMGYLVQMAGLTVHNFVSAAVGIVLAIVLIRGFARREASGIGNFWVDLTRCTLHILLPISIVVGLLFVWQGVPQNLSAYIDATTLEGAKQTLAQGPVASQEVIKVLGTNGGCFFNANSAHPYENPTALTNLVQMLLLIAIAAGLTNVLGRMVQDERQGWAIFAVMGILLLIGVTTVYWSESHGNPAFAAFDVDSAHTRISRQEAGSEGGEDDHALSPQLLAVDIGLYGNRSCGTARARGHCKFRAARVQRDPLCLRIGHRQQRQLVCRPFHQHGLLQHGSRCGDGDGTVHLCDPAAGGCRLAGAKEAHRPVGRVGSDPQSAICGITGRRRADHGRPRLFSRRVARTRDQAGGDEPRNPLSGSLIVSRHRSY